MDMYMAERYDMSLYLYLCLCLVNNVTRLSSGFICGYIVTIYTPPPSPTKAIIGGMPQSMRAQSAKYIYYIPLAGLYL